MSDKQEVQERKSAGVFQDDNGNTSSMRIMSAGVLLLAALFGGKELFADGGSEHPELIAYLVAAVMGGKSIQKIGESLKKS